MDACPEPRSLKEGTRKPLTLASLSTGVSTYLSPESATTRSIFSSGISRLEREEPCGGDNARVVGLSSFRCSLAAPGSSPAHTATDRFRFKIFFVLRRKSAVCLLSHFKATGLCRLRINLWRSNIGRTGPVGPPREDAGVWRGGSAVRASTAACWRRITAFMVPVFTNLVLHTSFRTL